MKAIIMAANGVMKWQPAKCINVNEASTKHQLMYNGINQ
jgi:hypothetical protein